MARVGVARVGIVIVTHSPVLHSNGEFHPWAAGACLAVALLILLLEGCAHAPIVAPAPQLSPASDAAAAGLIDLRILVPDVDLDIRYAGNENFLGRPVDGYDAPACLLLRPAAVALQRVEHALRPQHLRLRIFDCYRPARAVREFVAWAEDIDDQHSKAEYYPALDKSQLLGDYIAPLSGHSRGATVDLTLLECDAAGAACLPLDMGTPFDFFDPRAHTASPDLSDAQRANRQRLLAAMAGAGFENYAMEWWHFTLQPEPSPQIYFDVALSGDRR